MYTVGRVCIHKRSIRVPAIHLADIKREDHCRHLLPSANSVSDKMNASSDCIGANFRKRATTIKFEDCIDAYNRTSMWIKPTPLVQASFKLSRMLGMNLYFKEEFRLPTGSFKERGARNALQLLPQAQQKKGVIAASAGNHALALAHHGRLLKIPVTVVMPVTAPVVKTSKCQANEATVILQGNNVGEAHKFAMDKSVEDGLLYINGFDDPHILAGQSTVALEILAFQATSHVDAVVIPVGGGGLIAGMSVVFKYMLPCAEVIGVESENCPGFHNSMQAGRPVEVSLRPTVADGLALPFIGPTAFATAKNNVDRTVLVTEDMISLAVLHLQEKENLMVEGAGATGLAACLSGQLDHLKGKNVVVILTGGNIDKSVFKRCLDRGLGMLGHLSNSHFPLPKSCE